MKSICHPFADPATPYIMSSSATSWRGFPITLRHSPSRHIEGSVCTPQTLLTVIISGRSKTSFLSAGKRFHIIDQSGTVIFWKPNHENSDIRMDGDVNALGISLDQQKIELLTKDDPSPKLRSMDQLPHFYVKEDQQILRLALSMMDEISKGCPSGAVYGESLSLSLLSYLKGNFFSEEKVKDSNGLSPANLRLIKDFIQSNLTNDLTLSDLANLVHLSPRHFCRCFSAATGLPPYRYILNARIDLAKMMLMNTHRSITEIALDLGFSSTSHFSDAFRKVNGRSPRHFLQRV